MPIQDDTGVCKGTRRDGAPCTTPAQRGNPYCFAHDPALAGARSAGGKAKSNRRRAQAAIPTDLQDVQALLLRSLHAVEEGGLTPAQGGALASLAAALCKVHGVGEIEVRLRQLEDRVRAS